MRSALARPWSSTDPRRRRSRRRTPRRPGRRAAARARARPGCRPSRRARAPGGAVRRLLDLRLDRRTRPVVRDRGRHDHDVGVLGGGAHGVPQLRPRLGVHDVDARRGGDGQVRGDQRHAGAAVPAAARERDALPARRAVAQEPHRVDGLARAAGRDRRHAGRRGPARWSRRGRARPRRSLPAPGSRPGPVSAPVSRPATGSSTCTPRDRRVATLATVAGCSHISVCIAGASRTGHRATSSVAVSRSSAWPVAARASRSAVAGATITSSAYFPTATCATWSTSSKTSVVTG